MNLCEITLDSEESVYNIVSKILDDDLQWSNCLKFFTYFLYLFSLVLKSRTQQCRGSDHRGRGQRVDI